MDIFLAVMAFAGLSMTLIEAIPLGWRKAIGGIILLSALLLGIAPEY